MRVACKQTLDFEEKIEGLWKGLNASPKQVVSGQSLKSNAISVVWEKMLLPTKFLMLFTSNI